MFGGQAEYQTTLDEACSFPKEALKAARLRPWLQPVQQHSLEKVTLNEKRLRYYLKSVEKHNVFHYGAKQFPEPEVETAWDYSSFKEWHTRFT